MGVPPAQMVKPFFVGGAVGLVVGLCAGAGILRPQPSSDEPPAPPARQQDGSLILERTAPTKEPPPHEIPKGSREERRVSVVVKPPRGVAHTILGNSTHVVEDMHPKPVIPTHVDSCDCPPVQVDLSLVRMPDDSRRVVASSPTGEIISGLDIPIIPPPIPQAFPWAAGAIVGNGVAGAFLDRDFWRIRAGVEAAHTPSGWIASARVGVRF